eukprot:TRINITY_DN3566_c0_g1_i1.p1 TRINITY_DN3566_c0_g1~~TRINITY_DN3566_c0_g1_i1.p1  ORF type:complete len:414 (+),score=88.97 TRINITY_DN3566_c0_g1_i1:165-1406(+)
MDTSDGTLSSHPTVSFLGLYADLYRVIFGHLFAFVFKDEVEKLRCFFSLRMVCKHLKKVVEDIFFTKEKRFMLEIVISSIKMFDINNPHLILLFFNNGLDPMLVHPLRPNSNVARQLMNIQMMDNAIELYRYMYSKLEVREYIRKEGLYPLLTAYMNDVGLFQDVLSNGTDLNLRELLVNSARNGLDEIVSILLQDKRINSSKNWINEAVGLAATHGKDSTLKLMMKNKKVDLSENDNLAIIGAARNGHLSTVSFLLQQKRVDPSDQDNQPLRVAIASGNLPMFSLLMKDKRVSLSSDSLEVAAKYGHDSIVSAIIADKRTNSFDLEKALNAAVSRRHHSVISLLLRAYPRLIHLSLQIAVKRFKVDDVLFLLSYLEEPISEATFQLANRQGYHKTIQILNEWQETKNFIIPR